MRGKAIILFGFILLLFLLGCNDSTDSHSVRKSETNDVMTARVEQKQDKLVTVDGKTLRYTDVEGEVDLRIALLRQRKRKTSDAAVSRMRAKLFKQAIPHFVQTQIYLKYAMENKLVVRTDERLQAERDIAKTYEQPSFAALKKRLLPEQVDLLEKGMGNDLLVSAAKEAILKQAAISITDNDVKAMQERMRHLNQVAGATNALVYAHATNIWRKIEANHITFSEAVADYSEADDASADGAWAMVKISQMADEPKLAKLLRELHSGDITPPIEVDNGLCIIKVESRKLDHPSDTEDTYELSRIFLRLPVMWEHVPAEELRDGMKRKAEREALAKKFKELLGRSKVEQHVKKQNAVMPPIGN